MSIIDESTEDKQCWEVSVPEIWLYEGAYTPDKLLGVVQGARDAYQTYLSLTEQAKELVKAHPQIRVKRFIDATTQGRRWEVSVLASGNVWRVVNHIEDVVDQIEQAINWLENNTAFQISPELCATLKACTAIKVIGRRVPGGMRWHVDMSEPQFSTITESTEELHQWVTHAHNLYEQSKETSETQPASAE